MNPVFGILVVAGLVVLWFIISFLFIPFGRMMLKKWNKTVEILNKQDQIEKENEENE